MKKMELFCVLLIIVLVLSNCVSTGKYNLKVKESDHFRQELVNAKKQLADNEANQKKTQHLVDSLGTVKAEMEANIQILNQKIGEKAKQLEEQNAQLLEEKQRMQSDVSQLSAEKEAAIANLKKAQDKLIQSLQSEIQKGQIQITQLQDKLSVNIVDQILFESGKAEVSPKGQAVLARVAPILNTLTDHQIQIEGHTDNVRIGKELHAVFPSNWELSTARATNVVRYLIDKANGNPEIISATGYSQYRPIMSNNTSEGRSKNRRIEIVILRMDVERVIKK